MYKKVDEHEAIALYQGHSSRHEVVIDTNIAFEEGPLQSSTRIVARCFKQVMIGWICTQGTSPLEALKALISMAANHKQTVTVMHIDVSRASFDATVQRLVLVRLPVERQDGRRCWGKGLLKKSMHGTLGRSNST